MPALPLILSCLILGDSIADGTATIMRGRYGTRCETVAQRGAGSAAILAAAPSGPFDAATISAGSNDPANPRLPRNLLAIRARIRAVRVVWILPYNRAAAASVASVARRWGDLVIDLAWAARADGAHPRSYRWIARSLIRGGYANAVSGPFTGS